MSSKSVLMETSDLAPSLPGVSVTRTDRGERLSPTSAAGLQSSSFSGTALVQKLLLWLAARQTAVFLQFVPVIWLTPVFMNYFFSLKDFQT